MTPQQIAAAQKLTRLMMEMGVLKAIGVQMEQNSLADQARAALGRQTPIAKHPVSRAIKPAQGQSGSWPARPAKTPGETTCNTRCINGSCWRTYDSGRHVHFTVPPSVDPFSGDITFNQPPC
jgi:hypothetical protein